MFPMHSSRIGFKIEQSLITYACCLTVVLMATVGSASAGPRDTERVEENRLSSLAIKTPSGGDPDCTDSDGDGYGEGADCAGPDCNDDDDAINPGVSEACDDANANCCNGVDDNCDGVIDENATAFTRDGTASCDGGTNDGQLCKMTEDCPDGRCLGDSPTFLMFGDLALGTQCVEGLGICTQIGNVVCKDDFTGARCDAVPGDPDPRGEGLDKNGEIDPTVETCFDRIDNDCDGLVDHGNEVEKGVRLDTNCTAAEVCDGFDNDNDGVADNGFPLGDACTSGTGACTNSGTIVCDANGGTECNAVPLPPSSETGPGSARCTDGIDNDCDGLLDLADAGCQEEEKCDGKDNDGDGEIDETFAGLGEACVSGIGPCERAGITICSADGNGTVCTAVAATGSPEGPSGLTCEDGIDNDCDGDTDGADVDCGSMDLTALCALPFLRGNPGSDCTGWHEIRFGSTGGSGSVEVIAELLVLDVDGSIMAALPVNEGEAVHLASRVDPADWKWVTRKKGRRTHHEIFAPIPVLHVIAQDGFGRTEAYCSNIPYVQVLQPANTVVSASSGAVTEVLAAIPQIDLATLSITIDGQDILADAPVGLGIDPATQLPGGPFNGDVMIGGGTVTITELIVSAGPIGTLASNTVTMSIAGLGCGGHIVAITGDRIPNDAPPDSDTLSSSCYVDDLADNGTVFIFSIEVTSPTEGEVTPGGPTNVVGEACHGLALASVNINGFDVDVAGQVLEPGDGVSSGDVYRLNFDVMVPETNLTEQIATGTASAGSFTKGSNRLVAQACDGDGNCTFDSLFFAVGPIIPAPSATASLLPGVTAGVPDPGEVTNAYVLSISQEGIDTFFESLKNKNKRCLGDRAKDALKRTPTQRKKLDVPDACDPPTIMVINNTSLRNNVFPLEVNLRDSVTLDPRDGAIGVRINLPPIDITAHFGGYCESGCVCLFGACACASCVTVDIDGRINQRNMFLAFEVTRERLLQSGVPRAEREPLDVTFDLGDTDPNDFTRIRGEIDIGCLLGFLLDVLNFLGQVISLGFWDPGLGTIEFEMTADDIQERIGSRDGDPFDADFVKMENRDLPEFGTRQRDSRVTDAAISATGLSIAIGASFAPEPSEIDPAAAHIVGTPLKNAPIPIPPILDAQGNPASHVTIAISDDVFNQLFFSMVQTGRLKTQFEVTKTLGDFIPEDCSSIIIDRKRARCVGLRSEDTCTRFCARFDGCTDTCEAEYPYGTIHGEERLQCCRAARIRRNTNISIGTTLVLTGGVDNPPKLLITDDPATLEVEVTLQYDQISIHLLADRDGNGTFDGESIDTLTECTFGDLDAEFGTQSSNQTECILWETCLTVRLNLAMELTTNDRGKARLKFNFLGLERDVPFGVQCGGGYEVPELDFFNGEAGRSETMDLLEEKLGTSTPPLDAEGLELGGFVDFQQNRIIAIETDGNPDPNNAFYDYIGITGAITPRAVDPDAGCEETP